MGNERPILFSGAMVRAILAGTKRQTRRVVKRNAPTERDGVVTWRPGGAKSVFQHDGPVGEAIDVPSGWASTWCPYGAPGDRLWVRETFSTSGLTKYHDTGSPDDHGGPNDRCCAYAATGTYKCGKRIPDGAVAAGTHKWKPSIHMPRWASRITLAVESVRVERLHEITEEDARAEGVTPTAQWETHAHAFRFLWEQINGADSWKASPWVWVVGFSPVTP